MKSFDEFQIVENWRKVGMLDGLDAEQVKDVAFALEGQRLWNEVDTGEEVPSQFKRISIPIMRRALYDCIGLKGESNALPDWADTGIKYEPRVEKYNTTYSLDGEASLCETLAADLNKYLKQMLSEGVFTKFRCIKYSNGTIWANVG